MLTAVLNYTTGNVDIFDIPGHLDTNEKVEEYLEKECGYRMKDIYYMVNTQINYRTDLNEKAGL